MYEYLGHKELLLQPHNFILRGLGRGNATVVWKTPKFTLKTFRKANDIALLGDGIPYESNFKLLDAVVQPNILINYTLAKRHSGDEEVLQLYRGLLKDNNSKNHRFIWIVEDPNNFKKAG